MVDDLIREVLALSEDVRYVAIRHGGMVVSRERAGLVGATAAESDRYEELLVNPTLLTLLTQRGDIDCGGLQFVVIRYGNFFQFIEAIPGGHASVAIEAKAQPMEIVSRLHALLQARAEFFTAAAQPA